MRVSRGRRWSHDRLRRARFVAAAIATWCVLIADHLVSRASRAGRECDTVDWTGIQVGGRAEYTELVQGLNALLGVETVTAGEARSSTEYIPGRFCDVDVELDCDAEAYADYCRERVQRQGVELSHGEWEAERRAFIARSLGEVNALETGPTRGGAVDPGKLGCGEGMAKSELARELDDCRSDTPSGRTSPCQVGRARHAVLGSRPSSRASHPKGAPRARVRAALCAGRDLDSRAPGSEGDPATLRAGSHADRSNGHHPGARGARRSGLNADTARGRPASSSSTRVALYTRVSTEDQAREGFSLAAQRKRLRAFSEAQGWVVADEYVDDGYTGRDVWRPAYQRMIEERDRWDAILVLKIDRIHRNSRNFMAMMDDLKRWGKDFVSATESLDTSTATGRFVVDMLQRIVQLESEVIGERVRFGMMEAAQQGRFLGGCDAYGYRYDPALKTLVVVPEEAEVVRGIHRQHHAERRSMQEITEELNAKGVPTKRGGQWSKRQVFRVLRNPLYEGTRRWEGILTPGAHEAIVPPGRRRRGRRGGRRRTRS